MNCQYVNINYDQCLEKVLLVLTITVELYIYTILAKPLNSWIYMLKTLTLTGSGRFLDDVQMMLDKRPSVIFHGWWRVVCPGLIAVGSWKYITDLFQMKHLINKYIIRNTPSSQ